MNDRIVLFICAPNLGILDNWLPILWHLKNKNPDKHFVFVIPRSQSVDEIDNENVLFNLSKNIFDRVVFRSWFGCWLSAKTFSDAKAINSRDGKSNYIYKIFKVLEGKRYQNIYRLLSKLYSRFFGVKYNYWNLQEESQRTDFLLYDIYIHCKDYSSELMRAFKRVKKYSLSHGLELRIDAANDNTFMIPEDQRKEITAYLYSESERQYYRTVYGLSDTSLKIVGVPRHDISWIHFLLEREIETDEQNRERFIFIISRPAGESHFLVPKRKRKALVAIKRLATELNLNIVVKRHPKEAIDGIYEEIFEKSLYGDKWRYSNTHPFILGKKCAFAISFFSGVPVDMIVLDVPTIELLDLRGMPKYDNKDSLRDQNGNPVFTFRYYGLVLGANEYCDLKLQADRILHDGETVKKQLRDKYYEMFAEAKSPVIIADEIASDVDNR